MKNPLKTYQFWFKILGAALLIVFGVFLIVDNSTARLVVLLFTGLVTAIFAIIRLVPLFKTLKTKRAKLLSFIEISVHLLLGAYLCYAAYLMKTEPNSEISVFNDLNYRFFIAFIFYSRALVYFICTDLFKEETDKIKFWIHIILMTLACVICAYGEITSQAIAVTIAVIAFLVSIILIGEGTSGYGKYRKTIAKERNKDKTKNETKEEGMDLPNKDIIIPVDDNHQDSAIVS